MKPWLLYLRFWHHTRISFLNFFKTIFFTKTGMDTKMIVMVVDVAGLWVGDSSDMRSDDDLKVSKDFYTENLYRANYFII